MRVTNQIMINRFLSNITKSTVKMEKEMQKLSTGQNIFRPSDDPAALAELMIFKKGLKQTEQYIRNLDYGEGWFDVTDVALGGINNILHEAVELAVRGANGTWNQTDREVMAQEVERLKQELMDIANTRYEGKYIFARYDLTQKPFENMEMRADELSNQVSKQVEIAPNITIDLLNDGKSIFQFDGELSVFDKLQKLSDDIKSGNSTEVMNSVKEINDLMNHFLNERVKVGAKGTRVENTRAKLEQEKINLSEMVAKLGDVDMAEVMMNYKMQETVYQSALVSGTKIMGISLLDYIK